MDVETSRGTAANTSNNELLVDMVVLNLIHEVLNGGIEIARVCLVVSLKGQLSLCKGRISDTIEKMVDTSSGVIGSIMGLLYQGQHGLIGSLVALYICSKSKPTPRPIVAEVLGCFLQLGSQHVLCPSTKESFIQLLPGSAELIVQAELININLCLSSLYNALQFKEASCIVFCCLAGIEL